MFGPSSDRLERRVVVARFREEQRLLHLGVHRRAECAAEAAERAEEGRHDLVPIGAVWKGTQIAEGRLIQLDGAAVRQGHRRVRKISVRQDVEDARRAARHRPGVGQDLLLAVGERVRRPAQRVVEVLTIRLQARLGRDEPVDRRLPGLEDFRIDERNRRPEGGADLRHLLAHALMLAVARVLVGQQAGVRRQPDELLVLRVNRIEGVRERGRRRRQLPFELFKRRDFRGKRLLGRAPRGIRRIDIREIPFVLVGNLRPVAFLGESRQRERDTRERRGRPADRPFHGRLF